MGFRGRTLSLTGLAPGSNWMWNLTAAVLPKSVSLVDMAVHPSKNIWITSSMASGSWARMGFSDSFNCSVMNCRRSAISSAVASSFTSFTADIWGRSLYRSASKMCPTWQPRGNVTSLSLKFVTYTFTPLSSRRCTPPCTKSSFLFIQDCVILGTTHTSFSFWANGCAGELPFPLSMRTTVVCLAFSSVGSRLCMRVAVSPQIISLFRSW